MINLAKLLDRIVDSPFLARVEKRIVKEIETRKVSFEKSFQKVFNRELLAGLKGEDLAVYSKLVENGFTPNMLRSCAKYTTKELKEMHDLK